MDSGTNQPAVLKRLRAALALRGLNFHQFVNRCGASEPHVRAVLLGERKPSERLSEAIKKELGPEGWAFVRGQVDTLNAAAGGK